MRPEHAGGGRRTPLFSLVQGNSGLWRLTPAGVRAASEPQQPLRHHRLGDRAASEPPSDAEPVAAGADTPSPPLASALRPSFGRG